MKHIILVKFNDRVIDKELLTPKIQKLFSSLTGIQGIHGVSCRTNCIDRPNRWDLMIEINMEQNALSVYDSSKEHLRWKREYGELLESKAIFDYED